ncbi:D-arabinose 5-phosphate isomerase [Gammaproteobacteria bacterium 45_16_T64]|nr:D-arabinose 5-phosphate isomerase [Gammaproteobacteria bacterium 45_16_T64]
MTPTFDFEAAGKRVIDIEANATLALKEKICSGFTHACELILACKGRVIVSGMGKSGHIGKKIAATLASTGTPSFFVHPGEASHGDLGMITEDDIVIGISNSGKTEELTSILPLIKRKGVPLISMTGDKTSPLAQLADAQLDVSVDQEACSLGLAPTSSTTVTLVMGDALAVALLEAKGFTSDDFALSHPGGSLGRRLLLLVETIMHTGENIPLVSASATIKDALLEMSGKGLGMTGIVDEAGTLVGVYTDGDLRRTLDQELEITSTKITKVMSTRCKVIGAKTLAVEALNLMEDNSITALIVVDNNNLPIGALSMHDLLKAGVV